MSTFSKKNKLGLTLPSTAVDNSAESPTASLASVEKLQVSEKLDSRYTLPTPSVAPAENQHNGQNFRAYGENTVMMRPTHL